MSSILDVDLLAFENGNEQQRRAVIDGVMWRGNARVAAAKAARPQAVKIAIFLTFMNLSSRVLFRKGIGAASPT